MTAASELASYVDHTLLAAEATPEAVLQLCDEAREHGFRAVCVNGVHVSRAVRRLEGSSVIVAATVGFPLGAARPDVKAFEARLAVEDGARELDVVIQVGALLAGDDDLVRTDLLGVTRAAESHGARVKAILETTLLGEAQTVRACALAREAGAHFVKTSTGLRGGATVESVRLLARATEGRLGVKASGGIRTAADARRMIAAGATRIGTSSGVALVTG